jgi:hypothetical protein
MTTRTTPESRTPLARRPRHAAALSLTAVVGAVVACNAAGDANEGSATTSAVNVALVPNSCGVPTGTNTHNCSPWAWEEDRGWIDVAGIVTGDTQDCWADFGPSWPRSGSTYAALPDDQHMPQLSDDDWGGDHDDGDLELSFVPTAYNRAGYPVDWSRTQFSPSVAILRSAPQHNVRVEAEFQYVFPTVMKDFNDGSPWTQSGGAVLREGKYPMYDNGGDTTDYTGWLPWVLPIPQPGDQFAIRGHHVADCGHQNALEIHPPQAMAWMRQISRGNWIVGFNAASHSYRPAYPSQPDLRGFYPQFTLTDYVPGSPISVWYMGDAFLETQNAFVVPYGPESLRTCNNNPTIFSNHPQSYLAGGDPCLVTNNQQAPVSAYFNYNVGVDANGIVTLKIDSVPGTENAGSSIPNVGSGTFAICHGYSPCLLPGGAARQGLVFLSNNANWCMDAAGGTAVAVGSPVQAYRCNNGPNQHWQWDPWTKEIRGIGFAGQSGSGMCLDAVGGGTADGTRIQMYPCHGGPNQRWEFDPTPGASPPLVGSFINVGSGRCLDLPDGALYENNQLQLFDCNGGAAQMFKIGG